MRETLVNVNAQLQENSENHAVKYKSYIFGLDFLMILSYIVLPLNLLIDGKIHYYAFPPLFFIFQR